jgi:hypothetical protein
MSSKEPARALGKAIVAPRLRLPLAGFETEKRSIAGRLRQSEDFKEGVEAFTAKPPPKFIGR